MEYFLQKLCRKASNNTNNPRLCSTHGKANNQTFYKIKTKIFDKRYYETY